LAIQLKPDFYQAHKALGDCCRKLKKYDDSLVSYNKAIEIKNTYAEVYKKKADSLRNLNRFDESL
jgi:tetratricopeptide (TPR) repeat protein